MGSVPEYFGSLVFDDRVMTALRTPCDGAETIVGKDAWFFPSYADILFST